MRYQVPFEGRKTATSNLPSPSKSPIVGLSPAVPNWLKVNVPFDELAINRFLSMDEIQLHRLCVAVIVAGKAGLGDAKRYRGEDPSSCL